MGNILQDWLKIINDIMKQRLSGGKCELKILILDPDGDTLKIRAFDEMCRKLTLDSTEETNALIEKRKREFERMYTDLKGVLDDLSDLKKRFDVKNCLSVRLVHQTYINSSILMFDEDMIVTNYLHQTGTNSPILEISGKNKILYQIFMKEFERVWNVSRDFFPKGALSPNMT